MPYSGDLPVFPTSEPYHRGCLLLMLLQCNKLYFILFDRIAEAKLHEMLTGHF